MRSRIPASGLAAGLMLAGAWSAGAVQYSEDWRRIESAHFVLVGNASERAMQRVGSQLEAFRHAVLGVNPDLGDMREKDTTIVVFRHEAAFRPFGPEDSVGYFSAGPYRNYIGLMGDRDLERVIYHEYIHQLTRRASNWPAWMREGAAEFYSTIEIDAEGDEVVLGRSIQAHIQWVRRAYVPLAEFLIPPVSDAGESDVNSLYAQGWALYHYMALGRPELGQNLDRFNRLMEDTDDDVEASVEGAFGMDLEALESDFRDYILNAITIPLGRATLADPVRTPGLLEMPASEPVGEDEALFYLGDLLLHLGRNEDAESYLMRALGSGTEYEPALTALSVLYDLESNPQAASEFLERALEVPTAGYLPHLIMAQRSLEGTTYPESDEEARNHLQQVISLEPDLAEGHFWMGQILMRRPESLSGALSELETGLELSGQDPLMRLVYARALAMSGETDRATGVLMGLEAGAIDRELRDQARELREEIRSLTAPGGL